MTKPKPFTNHFSFADLPEGWRTDKDIVYSRKGQQALLYDGKPCIYTDTRYQGQDFPIVWGSTAKALTRKLNRLRGFKKGQRIELVSRYVGVPPSYYKVKQARPLPQFNADLPGYLLPVFDELGKALRESGWLVEIIGNVAYAHGDGKRAGWSSGKTDRDQWHFHDGKTISYDQLGSFDKWAKCEKIDKSKSLTEILDVLTK